MWFRFSGFILGYKKLILILFIAATIFWGFQAAKVKLAFNPGKILPTTDATYISYTKFKQKFGEDGTVMVLGIKTKQLFSKDFYNNWSKLTTDLEKIKGVNKVLSISNFKVLRKDTVNKKFVSFPFFKAKIKNQIELDSLKGQLKNLPFYQGILFNYDLDATIIAVTFDEQILQTKKKISVINQVYDLSQDFAKKQNVAVHASGLPYIKTILSTLVAKEFMLFLGLSILISALILGFFFRNWNAIIFPILFVLCGVVWSVGLMATLGYQITLLTGVIPPLMVIIGLPNCILILNKYHAELNKSVRKSIALKTTIEKIALTTFIANLTTAIGFGVLYFTNSDVLKEFGVTAAIGVMFTWLICLCLLPIICSYLVAPKTVDLKNKIFDQFLSAINSYVIYQRKRIYYVVGVLFLLAVVGISQIKVNGFVVDDLPKDDLVYQDLRFFERTFGGVLPLEISIDSKKKNGIVSLSNIKKMDKLERMINDYPLVGNSISLTNVLKYSSQVFYNNQPSFYRIPNEMEKNFILLYAANAGKNQNITKGLIDKNRQVSRITFQMMDIGSEKMNQFLEDLKPRVDSIFNPEKYQVNLTGPVILYVKGTNYLVNNLRNSLILAIFLIGLIMWVLFRGFKMVVISLLPNLIPLMITAGLMGLLGIPLKPSTILIFSIALGIASDQTIYFLTRYKQELNKNATDQIQIIQETIKETGLSMVYTAIILFFGFGVFAFSSFGGTIALGTLLALTLVLAMLFNLTFLPSLLLDLAKKESKLKS